MIKKIIKTKDEEFFNLVERLLSINQKIKIVNNKIKSLVEKHNVENFEMLKITLKNQNKIKIYITI